MPERKKYGCPVCNKKMARAEPFARHVMRHAGQEYTVCDTCGTRKRTNDQYSWDHRHRCRRQDLPHTVNTFTATAEALRGMLANVCGVIPAHIPGGMLPAPVPTLPAPPAAVEEAEVMEDEDEPPAPEELGELILEEYPPGSPDPEPTAPVAEVQHGPREPTLVAQSLIWCRSTPQPHPGWLGEGSFAM